MAEETDTDVLAELRGYAEWPPELDALAERAAAVGRLRQARDRALAGMAGDTVMSSPRTQRMTSWERKFFTWLNLELEIVLGLPPSFTSFADD
jgi:hypothetical protein